MVESSREVGEVSRPTTGVGIRSAWIWGALLALAALVNVLQFKTIQSAAERRYQAFATWNTPFQDHLLKTRYDTPIALAEVAPGSTLIVPKHSQDRRRREFLGQMEVFAKLKGIRYLDYDATTFLSELKLDQSVLAKTSIKIPKGHFRQPFVIIGKKIAVSSKGKKTKKGKAKNREFILVQRGSTNVMVDTVLVAKDIERLTKHRK